eukprot:scaffold268874_cov29-Prasinocladus_malaysianus.AAC.1
MLFTLCLTEADEYSRLSRLSELFCANVPVDPREKLAWLRSFRPGAVQTPEQLVDGVQLAAMLLDVIAPLLISPAFNRCCYLVMLSLNGLVDRSAAITYIAIAS